MKSETTACIELSKILVLCPHPDDFDVAAVTLRFFYRKGSEIYVAVAPTSRGVLDSFYDKEASAEQRIVTREGEQRDSMLCFGLEQAQFEFFPHSCDLDANGELAYSETNMKLVEQCVFQQRPEAIFIPHPNDANPAHSAMYQMVKEVLLKNHLPVKLFKQMDPKTTDLRIDTYTPMSDEDMAWKAQLFDFHKTQDHRNQTTRGITLSERILASNAAIAEVHQLSCSAAEAFEIEVFSDKFPVEVVSEYSDELFRAFERLVPQLADVPVPTSEHLKALVESPSSSLLVMRDSGNGQIMATITVAEYLIPTGRRAWVEDVILDQEYRGRRLADKLMYAAEDYAASKGVELMNLTSSPSRVAANRLYQKLGYELRETNAYRKLL